MKQESSPWSPSVGQGTRAVQVSCSTATLCGGDGSNSPTSNRMGDYTGQWAVQNDRSTATPCGNGKNNSIVDRSTLQTLSV